MYFISTNCTNLIYDQDSLKFQIPMCINLEQISFQLFPFLDFPAHFFNGLEPQSLNEFGSNKNEISSENSCRTFKLHAFSTALV